MKNQKHRFLDAAINPKVAGILSPALVIGLAVACILYTRGSLKLGAPGWWVVGFAALIICSASFLPDVVRKLRGDSSQPQEARFAQPLSFGAKLALLGIIWGLPLLSLLIKSILPCMIGMALIPWVVSPASRPHQTEVPSK